MSWMSCAAVPSPGWSATLSFAGAGVGVVNAARKSSPSARSIRWPSAARARSCPPAFGFPSRKVRSPSRVRGLGTGWELRGSRRASKAGIEMSKARGSAGEY